MQPNARRTKDTASRSSTGAADAPVILVVTGDSSLREVCGRVLEEDGYTVITAAHAGHAMLACLRNPHIDVLAVEMSMEDMSGPALAKRLRRHCPAMASVYFANSGMQECERVLVRPFTLDDFLAALALARGAAIAPLPTSAS